MSSFILTVHGQDIIINEFNNVCKITIDSPFQDPSYVMKDRWTFGCVGFGINQEIVDIILEKKFRLFIHDNESYKNFIVDNDVIVKFLEENNVDYKVRNTILKIFPKSIFKEL